MDPLKLLQDGLYNDNIAVVLKTLKRLETVALALGPSKARTELLPMLSQFATLRNADEMANENAAAATSGAECAGVSPLLETFDRVVSDEALAVLAEQLGELCSPTANLPAASILPMLEALMQADETCVREAAVRGTARMAVLSTPAQALELLLPCCERLASTTWFSGRCSSAQLITPIYKRLASDQGKSSLRQIVAKLVADETPMVRKVAFAALPELCSIVGVTFLRTDLVALLRALVEEDQDASRIYLADCAVETAKVVDATLANDISIPLVEEASADVSWRVRRHLARRFGTLCASSPAEIQSSSLMPIFVRLLSDPEGEVRAGAIESIVETGRAVGPSLTSQHIVPLTKALASDSFEDARFGFAKIVPSLCTLVDTKTAQSVMFPLLMQLLTDEVFDVRMNVLESMDVTAAPPGGESWAAILAPTLSTLSNDAKWRIRLGVVVKIPILTKSVGLSVYEQKYHPIVMRLICDTVSEVRTTTASQIKFLIQNFGTQWGESKLIPEIFKLFEPKTNYLHRLILHQVAMECIGAFKGQFAAGTLVSVLVNATKDPTPNVRLNAARSLNECAKYLDASYKSTQVKPVLQKLKDDPDPDVKFFSEKALVQYS